MLVSVITTLFNYQDYVGDCVTSFLKQDLKDSELVIVDDASTDDPMKVLSPFLGDRVRYIRLPQNLGYSHAKNVGIRSAKAEVIAMLDADDMLTKNSLTLRLKKLNEGYDLVHGPVLDLKNGKYKESKLWKQWLTPDPEVPCWRTIHAQGVMVRKSIHREIGLYDESLRSKSDREMWARVWNHGYRIGTVSEPVAIYRIHERQMHKSKEKLLQNELLTKLVNEKIEKRATDLSDVLRLE